MGRVPLRHGTLAEGEQLAREALEIDRAALPAGHPNIAPDLSNLAVLLHSQNKLDEAEPLLREALAIFRAARPAGHPDIATGLSNLARAQQGLGQTAEARAGFDEAIAMLPPGSPDGSALLARVLWRYGAARLENKDNAAALAELEEAVAMGEKVLPAEHPHLKEYRSPTAFHGLTANSNRVPDSQRRIPSTKSSIGVLSPRFCSE